MCSQRLSKLLKSNRNVQVIKACNTKSVYTLVTRALLVMAKPLILLRDITTLLLNGNEDGSGPIQSLIDLIVYDLELHHSYGGDGSGSYAMKQQQWNVAKQPT